VSVAPPEDRRRWRVLGPVFAVLAVGAAAMFAVVQFRGDDGGGAASPEELGRRVVQAIDDGDVLGLVDLLAPDERALMREPFVEFVGHLGRLGVVGSDVDLAGVQGIDITISHSEVLIEPTSVADITNLRLMGDARVVVDGQALPIGDLWLDGDVIDADRDMFDADTAEPFDVGVTAVEVDGGWYLSAFFSIAEAARGSLDPVPDIPEVGIEPRGGSSPEEALDLLLAGVEALDLTRIIASLNPGEAAALQRYAPMFIDDAQAELDLVPLDWRILESEYSISGSGDTRQAALEVLVIEGQFDGSRIAMSLVDGCATIEADGERLDTCASDSDLGGLEEVLGESPALTELVEAVADAFADYEAPGIVLRRTGGAWYVSPVSTMAESVLSVLRALDRGELDAIVAASSAVIDEWFGDWTGGGWTDEEWFGDDWTDDDWTGDDWTDDGWTDDDWTGDDWTGDDWTGDDSTDEPDSAVDQCYLYDDVTTATACFEQLRRTGEISDWQMPTELRFPECGVAEPYWRGYAVLTDEEFLSVVEAATPCFLQLVDDGLLDEFDLSYEYTHLECFEGRNWYAVFDDPAYDDRFFACIGR
jgi:hypothetical protein